MELDDYKKLAQKYNKTTTEQYTSVCPHCGYCPHCGRGRLFAPWYPYYPQPYWTSPTRWYDTTTGGAATIPPWNVTFTTGGNA